MSNNIERTFKKEGAAIKIKSKIADEEFSSKDVVINLDNWHKNVAKAQNDLLQLNNSRQQILEGISQSQGYIKELSKFEEWANEVQLSKLKALVAELKDAILVKVELEYEHDVCLTKEQDERAKFMQFQSSLATDKQVAEQIAPTIITKYLFTEPIFADPYA